MLGIGRKATRRVLLLMLVAAAAISLSAPASAEEAQITIRKVDTSRYPATSLSLTVSGSEKLQAQMLGTDNFVLRENGRTVRKLTVQPIANDPDPVAVVLVIDSSGSMVGKPLSDAKNAARAFINQMRFQDKIAIVAFDFKPRVISTLTSDKGAMFAAIDGIKAEGETALYDGLLASLDQLAASSIAHKNVIVLSDGGDTVSAASENSVIEKAAALRIPIFGVALQSKEYKPVVLQSICDRSGGSLLVAPNSGALTELYSGLAIVLHNQYKITYASQQDRSKKRTDIQLELKAADIHARSTASLPNPAYIAPKQQPKPARGPKELPAFLSPLVILVSAVSLGSMAVFLFVLVISSVMFSPSRDYREQLKFYELAWGKSSSARKESSTLTRMTDSVMTAIDYVSTKREFKDFLRLKLEQAALPLEPSEFILFHLAFVMMVAAAARLVLSAELPIMALAVIFSAILPVLVLQVLIERRKRRFHDQLPDTLTTIAGSMRAGYSFLQAISSVAEESAPPMSDEFRRVVAEARLGLPLETALEKMSERVDEENFTWAIMAINIQREVGGNLAEVLDILANTLRERDAVQRQIKALTADGRISAIILMVMPFVEAAIILVLNPGYMSTLFGTLAGLVMLFVALSLLGIGGLWLRRIVSIEV